MNKYDREAIEEIVMEVLDEVKGRRKAYPSYGYMPEGDLERDEHEEETVRAQIFLPESLLRFIQTTAMEARILNKCRVTLSAVVRESIRMFKELPVEEQMTRLRG